VSEIPSALTRRVAERARYRCEYCHTPQIVTAQTFHVDHIVPQALGGQTRLENLCYACPHCNLHKSDRIQAHDPRTGRFVRLFNPRADHWDDHLRWSPTYTRLIPRTAITRATIVTLDLNADVFITARTLWLVLGLIP
jgi:5-methylcytosine-specific restriction endonuclease McrA